MVAAACGDDDGTAAPGTSGPASTAAPATTLVPVRGGSISIGVLTEIAGLDPTMLTSSGTTGGIEAAAIYDTVMRYDPATKRYEGRTAASLDANSDFTEWTLRLKPNIRFTDGTAYDAEAVKFNIERHSAPTSRSSARSVLAAFVGSISVTDPLTVRFTLKQAWPAFPFLLTQNVGMIASPAAIQKAGAEFNRFPGSAGAGPFELVSYAPRESIIVRRNPTYHGGEVYLDQITFVAPSAGGDAIRLESLERGAFQVAVLSSDPAIVATAQAKFPSINRSSFAGSIVLMNAGLDVTCQAGKPAPACTDKPDGTKTRTAPATADVRVRRAVAAAIDVKVLNERAWGGKGITNSALLAPEFPWYPNVAGAKYDPEEARRLVAEVKSSTGWDGTIHLVSSNETVNTALALATKALLEQVGMRVNLSNQRDGQGMIQQVLVDRDFDLVVPWSYSVSDDDGAYNAIFNNLHSPGARYGYHSPDMDAAIGALRLAASDEAKRAAYGRISEVFNRDVPAAVIAARPTAIVHSQRLRGFTQSATAIVLLDKVWLSS
jgi:peptide/nickel transport system substrate-binding protein